MAASNRSALIEKAHKVLRKHFKPALATPDRPLLEQLLFACCLENARYEPAEEAFARLSTTFFDWNEVRVTTVKELAEAMSMLPLPAEAAERVKATLQSVFESTYSFDLEVLKKQNLGQAIQKLEKLKGTTPFAVAFVTQQTLGGHSIPLDRGALQTLAIVGLASPAEQKSATVAGLERTIPKNKGIEFGSLLHQLGAELIASPLSPNVHKILLEINAEAKERLPKRQTKKKKEEAEAPQRGRREEAGKKGSKDAAEKRPPGKKVEAPKSAAKASTSKGTALQAKKGGKTLVKPKPR